jgi:4-hydroxy-tetrahydrodipicolinate synthase
MHRDLGVVAAALTPRGKRGELNFGACFDLIDYLCRAKVGAIAVLTAAGEYPAFTVEERTRLVYLGTKRTRAPLLAGVGSEDLETSVELARQALGAGAHGVLLPPPSLFSYPQPELREYYLQFAQEVDEDDRIWIVGSPPLAPETMQQLLATGHFAGSTDADLAISAEANAIPELLVALDCARRDGDLERTASLASTVREFQTWADRFAPLVAVKAAATLRGIPMGPLRIPVAPERKQLLAEFREWFSRWLPVTGKMTANA